MRAGQLLAGLGLWLSLVVCGWIYTPGLAGPFLLDDRVNLENLDVLGGGTRYATDVALGNNSGPLGRPVSMLSFAGSYLAADGLNPKVFKAHNLTLHLVAASLVCWFAYLVLSSLRAPDPEWAAVLTATFWMMSPLMLSTVLYVIQRMAQLACVFTLLSLISYCKARNATRRPHAMLLAGLSLVFLVIAVLCKETALVGVPLLLLLEVAVFRPPYAAGLYRVVERCMASALALAALFLLVALIAGWQSDGILNYASRGFSLADRVLTQPRVLLDYMAGLLWPFKGGFGIFHDDFAVSRGWLQPSVTIGAAAAIAALLVISGVAVARRRALVIGFGFLFFFLTHGVESTIFPLEIYFEHRNYLPAVGLYLALGWGLMHLARAVPETRTLMRAVSCVWVMASAGATGIRASYWSSTELFSALAVTEHPASARANIAYGTALAAAGDPVMGATYFKTAQSLLDEPVLVLRLRELWLFCVAGQLPPDTLFLELDEAMESFGNPRIDEALDVLVQSVMTARCDRSVGMRLADSLLQFREGGGRLTERVTGLAAKLENFLGRYPVALSYARDLVGRAPRSIVGNLMVAYLAGQVGDADQRASAILRLRELECEGRLTLDQQASLEAIAGPGEESTCGLRQ
jgi:protein O-mannosyl-transferase